MKLCIRILIYFLLLTPKNIPQWFPQDSGTSDNFKNVEFISDNIGWVGSEFKIYKTNDGGNTWYIQKDFTPEYIISLIFRNENTGWLLSYYSLDQISRIYKTIDGGDTWQLKNLLNDTQLVDLDIVNDSLGWCVGAGGTPPSLWVPAAFKTTDSGETWESVSISPTYFSYLRSVEFVNESEGWISGANNIFKTIDGGQNWIEMPYISGGADAVKLQFLNSDTGWSATDYGGLLKTSDGGISWDQETGVQSINFYFLNRRIGWSVFGSSIYYTANGGELWVSQNSNTNNFLWDISFVDSTTGWAVGDGGTILNTSNGGTPVEFISFQGAQIKDNITLTWITSTEKNNMGFGIERKFLGNSIKIVSMKDTSWTSIGFIEGNGTTTENHLYSYKDTNVKPGKYLYRLKQIDFDGNYEYSKQIEVFLSTPNNLELKQNFPNPFNSLTNIEYALPKEWENKPITLKIFNSLGEEVITLVNEIELPGIHKITFDGSNSPSGVYIYRLSTKDYCISKKFILLK